MLIMLEVCLTICPHNIRPTSSSSRDSNSSLFKCICTTRSSKCTHMHRCISTSKFSMAFSDLFSTIMTMHCLRLKIFWLRICPRRRSLSRPKYSLINVLYKKMMIRLRSWRHRLINGLTKPQKILLWRLFLEQRLRLPAWQWRRSTMNSLNLKCNRMQLHLNCKCS